MTLPDGREIKYQYDDEGNLIARCAYAADDTLLDDERYLVQSSRLSMTAVPEVLASIDGRTKALRSRNSVAQGVFGQMEIKAEPGGGARPEYNFILTDAQGTPAARVGAGPTEHMDYEGAFGRARSTAGEGAAAGAGPGGVSGLAGMAYTNRGRDPLNGLQFHYARWLEPGLGLWLSPDPELDFPNNFGAAYTYVGQNAANRIDRLGLFSLNEQTLVSAIVGDLVRGAAFDVAMEILKAIITAAGVDTQRIQQAVVEFFLEAFNAGAVFERIIALAEENADHIELVMEVIQLATYAQLAVRAFDTARALIRLFLKRTISNVLDAVGQLGDLIDLLLSTDIPITVTYNVARGGLIRPIGGISGLQDHHLATPKSIKTGWTDKMQAVVDGATPGSHLRDLENEWNGVFILAEIHNGRHDPNYHNFAYETIRRFVTGISEGTTDYDKALQRARTFLIGDILEAVSKPSSVLK